MKPTKTFQFFGLAALGVAAMMALPPLPVLAADAEPGNWKMGRVYYRFVCTSCHKAEAGKVISPNEMTKAEWRAYLDADLHDKSGRTNASVQYYTSQAYREMVKDSNKAAAKFLAVPDDEMAQNIRAWTIYGAKDSDTASSCQ